MSVTKEVRRESYEDSRLRAPRMRQQIYQTLEHAGPMTAEGIMEQMGIKNPNSVRPRLTELQASGEIEAIGKAYNHAGKRVTLWSVVKRAADGAGDTDDGKPQDTSPMASIAHEGADVNVPLV